MRPHPPIMLSTAISCSLQTYAAVHKSTAGAENGKPLSCDGKTECIVSICMGWRDGTIKALWLRRIFPADKGTSVIIHMQAFVIVKSSRLCALMEKLIAFSKQLSPDSFSSF